jgi:hypothetical protein
VVISMPGQTRTRASKVSPSSTRSTSAGWLPRTSFGLSAAGGVTGAGFARTGRPISGAIPTPSASPSANVTAASATPPRAREDCVKVRNAGMILIVGDSSHICP